MLGNPSPEEGGDPLNSVANIYSAPNEPKMNGGPSEKKSNSLEEYYNQQQKQKSAFLNEEDSQLKRADSSNQSVSTPTKNTDLSDSDIDALNKTIGILSKQTESIELDTIPRQQRQNKEYSPRRVAGSSQDNRTVPPRPFFNRLFGSSTRGSSKSGSKQSKAQFESKEANIEISSFQKLIGYFGYSTKTHEDVFSPVMKRKPNNSRNIPPRQENSQPSLFRRILSVRKSNGTGAEGNKSRENGVSYEESTYAVQENDPTTSKHSSSQKSLESNGSSTTSGSSQLTVAASEHPFTDRSTQVSTPSTSHQYQWKDVSEQQVALWSFELSQHPVWRNYCSYPTMPSYNNAVEFIRVNLPVELVDKMLACHPYAFEKPVVICNAGLECYGIAAIHALFACKPLDRYLRDRKTESQFDHALRVLYAMYKFNWETITITPLLRNMGYEFFTQEDSEEFVRKFAERCYKDQFGQVDYHQRITCLRCSQVSFSYHANVRISLERSDFKTPRSGNIQQLINETAKDFVIDKKCDFCGYNKSTYSLEYVLPTIIPLHLNTLVKKNTVDDLVFETEVDFAPFLKRQEQKIYKLGGVVYYKELSEKLGHYFARVQYGNDSYIFDEAKIKRNGRVYSGTPYYALYYGVDE